MLPDLYAMDSSAADFLMAGIATEPFIHTLVHEQTLVGLEPGPFLLKDCDIENLILLVNSQELDV